MSCGGYHGDADGHLVDFLGYFLTTYERERDEWTIRVGLARERRSVHVRRYRRPNETTAPNAFVTRSAAGPTWLLNSEFRKRLKPTGNPADCLPELAALEFYWPLLWHRFHLFPCTHV